MKVLHLTLKKKWFDMIASGEKKEEYRELKEYWWKRLTSGKYCVHNTYDIVRFKNGYAKDAPTIDVEFKQIKISFPNQHKDWCDDADKTSECFVIQLGKIISRSPF